MYAAIAFKIAQIILIAYLLGSIPTGYLIVKKLKGIDIRTTGSGSTGATGSYELASTFESGFKPILPPSSYLQTINYTKNLTSSFYDNFSNFDFQHIIRDMIKSYFEDIKINESEMATIQATKE